MENSKLKRAVALALSVVMVFCLFVTANPALVANAAAEADNSTTDEALEILDDVKWAKYKEKYAYASNYRGDPITVNSSVADLSNGGEIVADYLGRNNVVFVSENGSVSWTIEVKQTGLYAIDIDYSYLGSDDKRAKAADIERTLRIDGEVPFTELRNLIFTKKWIDNLEGVKVDKDDYGNTTDIEYDKDSAGNERRPSKLIDPEWTTYTVSDPTGNYNGEFYFYLTEGTHVITLQSQKECMFVDTITLRERETLKSYDQYLAEMKNAGYKAASASSIIKMEAEFYTATSSSTIYGQNDKSSAITSPQDPKISLINDVGGRNGSYNWASVGQWIEWEITVPETGLYTIAPRFLQDAVEGLFVSRRLYINGEVPFEEANNLQFLFDDSWQTGKLTDGGKNADGTDRVFEFAFEKGKTYTIRLEVNFGNLGEIVAELRDCVTRVNAIYIKILAISGTSPDPYMDYTYYKRIPEEIQEMGQLAKRLYAVSEQMKEISGGESSSSTAAVENVARVLEKMAGDSERQIAKNFSQLKSYIGNLGTWINNIGQQALILDYFMVQPAETALPKAEGNFFDNAWYEIQMFFYSFFYDNSSFGAAEAGDGVVAVDVWTTVSREYTQIMRTIIDQEFAQQRPDIAINLKLVTAGTLLPATLSGVGPDVMMDVTSSDCINYAVRGAVLDLKGYDGFSDVVDYFHESAWTPFVVALGSSTGEAAVYGIPEKQSFNVMFYRKDIFADLGLKVPKTWDEFNAIMPILVSQNYDVGMSHDVGIFNTFIYQNGGSLYSNAGTTISFDEDVTLDAFTQLCHFFTTYNFPLTFDAANRFRSGEMPMFIGDYITYYNQFTVFAPELKGLWGFTTVPGTVQADGEISYKIATTMNSIVIMMDAADRGTDQAGFDFIKWWMSADVQGKYANELVALLGPAGKYATANRDAFADMSWTANELTEINNQIKNLQGVPEMPGSYIIARNVEFAFLDVYNNDAVPSEALQDYTNTINAEFKRKRDELNKEFYVPADFAQVLESLRNLK